MRKSSIDLEDPIGSAREGFAMATEVGVGNAAVLRRPDHLKLRRSRRQFFHELMGVVPAHVIQHHQHPGFTKVTTLFQHLANELLGGRSFVRHRANNCEREMSVRRSHAEYAHRKAGCARRNRLPGAAE